MRIFRWSLLLFALNLIDALLTVYWVHNGFATESNQLMAGLLELGYAPFLAVKISVGAIAAIVLWRWGNLRLARYGLTLVLAIYISLMGVHFLTGLTAFGFISKNVVNNFSTWSHSFFAFFR
ncbi:MAG: DUF5658 family protein [Pyrinomonadaceae bacterium]